MGNSRPPVTEDLKSFLCFLPETVNEYTLSCFPSLRVTTIEYKWIPATVSISLAFYLAKISV